MELSIKIVFLSIILMVFGIIVGSLPFFAAISSYSTFFALTGITLWIISFIMRRKKKLVK